MADSGVSEVALVSGIERATGVEGVTGVLPPDCEVKGGECVSPKIRRSERKRPLRSISGHLLKSRPKSPLIRMAEMRISGLHGGALRLLGLKGSGGSDLKLKKERKGPATRGSQVLVSDLEITNDVMLESGKGLAMVGVENNLGGGLEVGALGPASADEVVVEMSNGSQIEEVNNEGSKHNEIVMVEPNEAALSLNETDYALDLCEAQPLQNMAFLSATTTPEIGTNSLKMGNESSGNKWANLQGSQPKESLSLEEFPHLSKDLLGARKIKGASSSKAGQWRNGEQGADEVRAGESSLPIFAQRGSSSVPTNYNGNGVGGEYGTKPKQSIADILKSRETNPIFFEPEKIEKIGIVGETAGLPSISFSGPDTSFLAEKMGHAVVGKFSHSIPSAQQIQKALQ